MAKRHDKLNWLTGWSWQMFKEPEEYGILFIFPAENSAVRQWIVYDRFSGMIVAVTEGVGQELAALGESIQDGLNPTKLAEKGYGLRLAA